MTVNRLVCWSLPRLSAVGLAFAFCIEFASAQGNLRTTRTALSGVESLLASERAWDRSCNGQETRIAITKRPLHGTVSVVSTQGTIPESVPRTGNTGPCAGKSIMGNQVMYKSDDGFHGMDEVSYVVTYVNGHRATATITIDVQ